MEHVAAEVTRLAPCRQKVRLSVAKPLVDRLTEEVYAELRKNARVPGFRRGAVPMEVVRARYADVARERILNRTLEETLFPTLREKNIAVVEETMKLESVDFGDHGCVYELTLETEPEFKLKQYKGLKLRREIKTITDKDVDDAVQSLRERAARLEVSPAETVSADDLGTESRVYAVVDYAATADGVPIRDMTGTNVLIELASNRLPAGLKEGLVGMKRGERKVVPITLPANFPKIEYAAREVQLSLTLKEIKHRELPEADDAFAKDMGAPSLAELRANVAQSLQQRALEDARERLRNHLFDLLVREHDFALPETELASVEKSFTDDWRKEFVAGGGKEADFILTEEQTRELRAQAERTLKLSYILKRIVAEEKLTVTEEELAKERGRLRALYPGKEAAVDEYVRKHHARIVSRLLEEKLVSLMLDTAKIKDVELK